MGTIDCCDASGGRVVITANGKRWSARSAVTVKPTTFERKAEANQDSTLAVQNKAAFPEADIVLSDRCGLFLDDIMGCPIDVTIDLIDMRRKYYFTKAIVVGRPSINSETGEIRDIKIVCSGANLNTVNY
jgi:hypothetical protein